MGVWEYPPSIVDIPSYMRFIEPLLRYLARQNGEAATRDVYEPVADILGLSPSQRGALLPSGRQAVYRNRIGWAHDRLKRAGLSTSPRRGYLQLTATGRAFASQHAGPLSEEEVIRLADVPEGSRLRPPEDDEPGAAEPSLEAVVAAVESPEERLEQAIAGMNASVAHDLLEVIGQSTPEFFEGLVLDLLHAMGYGTNRADLQQVGGSGDGGIDGIVSLDRLGLEKVYVQAKRWQSNSVSRPDVQAFYGALAGRRARKGVFITTSTFTREATEFARQVESIVLVDGAHLSALMIEHAVGVTHREVKIAKLDNDYFEE